jgi:hypothetical protein
VVSLVLTDIEMPETDGYMLTKQIKSDPRFAGIPVLMHSSLSGMSNQQLGRSVGVDEYVSKFEPQRLAATITRLLVGTQRAGRAAAERRGRGPPWTAPTSRCWRTSMPAPSWRAPTAWRSCCSRWAPARSFGINVFKVREVSRTPMITRTPNMPPGVEGLISCAAT